MRQAITTISTKTATPYWAVERWDPDALAWENIADEYLTANQALEALHYRMATLRELGDRPALRVVQVWRVYEEEGPTLPPNGS